MAESAIFILSVISSASRRSFCGAPALRVSSICRSISVGRFVDPWCSAAINLSSTFLLIEVSVTATGMDFPLLRTVVHYCTRSVLGPDAAMVAIVGRGGGCEYLETRVGAGRSL